jgi:hypothetical protein
MAITIPKLVARQRLAVDLETSLREALDAATSDNNKRAYAEALYLVAHPECCHTAADYPGWVPGCPACPPNDNAPEVTL